MDGFDIDEIDDVIHGRVRLGVMAYLASAQTADFNEIKRRLQTTDGNLSVHLRKLEDAGYIGVEKSFVGRKPLTRLTLTPRRPRRLPSLSGRHRQAGGGDQGVRLTDLDGDLAKG
jgi:DNA-binding HxlR family transcriptional regulator